MSRNAWLIGAVLAVGVGVALVLAAQARRLDPALRAFDAWGGVPAWGEAVDGLRARLLADRRRYPVGEAVVLVLEIQNVGRQTVLLTAPQLQPSVEIPDEQPLARAGGHNTFITAEPLDDGEFILREVLEEQLQVLSSPVRLPPNAVYTMIVRSVEESKQLRMEKLEKVERVPQPERVAAHHWFADRPGRYRLTATILMPPPRPGRDEVRHADGGRWQGKLTTPPIDVDVMEADENDV